MSPKPYRHNKTGKIYWLIDIAVDFTNHRADADIKMAIYHPTGNSSDLCVRDWSEFQQKFTALYKEILND